MLLLDYRVHQATVQRHVKMFLITDDRDFRPQTCTNGLVFRECKHIKNIFEDVYFTKNSFHITLTNSVGFPMNFFFQSIYIPIVLIRYILIKDDI